MAYYNPQQQYVPRMGLKGYPVSSLDEVRGALVDFDGSTFFFPDIGNKRIYTKQINLDGTSTLGMYTYTDIPVEKPTTYITKDELDSAIAEIKEAIGQLIQQPKKQNTEIRQF